MKLFRLYLVVVLISLGVYTLMVGSQHGWNLLPIFFANIADMSWPGQFNFDFMTFLGLSGILVAWRHQFSVFGLFLGLVCHFCSSAHSIALQLVTLPRETALAFG